MEKFVVKKCARFFAQNERLCLPVLELMYVWNGFRIVGKNWTLIQNCYRLVERTVKDLERRKKGSSPIFFSQFQRDPGTFPSSQPSAPTANASA